MGEWIKINDKMPEDGQPVLLTNGEQIMMGFRCALSHRFTQVNTWNDSYSEQITHWMPLPELPHE